VKELTPSEMLVQRVLEAELGVEVHRSDLNTGQARHDFELSKGDTTFAALEVTEDREPSDAQWRYLGEPLLPIPGCRQGWRITLWSAPSRPNRWSARHAAPFLRSLERLGAQRHSIYPDSPIDRDVPAALSTLGYVAATVDPSVPNAQLRLSREGWGETIRTTDELSEWVTAFAASSRCAGERAKLADSGFDSRHLAVVIPFVPASGRRVFDLLMAVRTFGLPARRAVLPREIGTLWLICDYPGVRSLSVSSEGIWSATEPATPAITSPPVAREGSTEDLQ
jgi:hypothetical protein